MILTKGIIEEVVSQFKARVRLPVYHGIKTAEYSTPTKDLPTATLCAMPNCTYSLNIGDVVYCSIEDNDFTKPVILGFLYKQDKAKTLIDMNVNSLNVGVNASFPEETSIGKVSPQSIQNLYGADSNIQNEINDIVNDNNKNNKELQNSVSELQNDVASLETDLSTNYVDKSTSQIVGGQKDFEVTPRVKIEGEHPREGLPDIYTQLQYVYTDTSSTGPYIDTGFVINTSTDIIELVFEMVDTTRYLWLFGEHDTSARFGLGVGDGIINQRNVAYGNATNKVSDDLFYGKLHYFKADSTGVFIDNTNKVANYSNFTSTSTIALFCLHINGAFNSNAKGKIQSYKHTRNGVVLLDLVSVKRKSDNKVGFYDFANNRFVVSDNGVDLIAGPGLTEDHYEPLLSDVNFVDFLTNITGYNPNVTQTLKHNNNGLLWVND